MILRNIILICLIPSLGFSQEKINLLEGTWKTICHNMSGVTFSITEYMFLKEKYRIRTSFYKDSLCKKPLETVVRESGFEGTYSIGRTIITKYSNLKVHEVDFISYKKNGDKVISKGIYKINGEKLFFGVPVPVGLCSEVGIERYERGSGIEPFFMCLDRSYDLDFSYYLNKDAPK